MTTVTHGLVVRDDFHSCLTNDDYASCSGIWSHAPMLCPRLWLVVAPLPFTSCRRSDTLLLHVFDFAELDRFLMPLITSYPTSYVVIALFTEYFYGFVLPMARSV